jgi:hypothetical protein
MHESETSPGLNPDQETVVYQPGTVVRITQQIPRRLDTYTVTVTGKVLKHERQSSGSWFARNKSDKVWLDRLIIQKTDGEISILNLDEYTAVEVLQGAEGIKGESPLVQASEDPTASLT